MAKTNNELQSWQIFHAARKFLSVERIVLIFGKKNARSVYTWAQDPRVTDDRCKDPLEATHTMLQDLDAIGRGDVARAAIDYLSTAIDHHDQFLAAVHDLKPTISEEILADFQAVSIYARSIESCENIDIVDALRQGAIDEINRTHAKFLKDCK